MSLSITKLEKMLKSYGYILVNFFLIDNYCNYIELYSLDKNISFMLYIPSDYDFILEKNNKNIFSLTKVKNLNKDLDIIPDEIKDIYKKSEIELPLDDVISNENIKDTLESGYKKNIDLPQTTQRILYKEFEELKKKYNQLLRMSYSMETIEYKLCLFYKKYLFIIRRDNSIECHIINEWHNKKYDYFLVTTDLEVLFKNPENISININYVKKGIYDMLLKNKNLQQRMLYKFLNEKDNIINLNTSIENKLNLYDKNLDELYNMLKYVKKYEKNIIENIETITNKYTYKNSDLNKDIFKSNAIYSEEKKFNKYKTIKNEIITTIDELNFKKSDIILNIDNILFENQIMFHTIYYNLKKLSKLANKS